MEEILHQLIGSILYIPSFTRCYTSQVVLWDFSHQHHKNHKKGSFSRIRSEGFPFIVGVWGWTCVRFVFLVSSSPRRRVVVASSSPRRRQLVNFSPLGGTFALRHTSYFQSMKSGGSLARNALFGGVKSQNGRSFSCFA